MQNLNPCNPRPHLVSANSVAHALSELEPTARTPSEIWRLLTERFVVDLDTVAKVLPTAEPETMWLPART